MKNFIKIVGIIAMAAIIGFAFAACEGPMGPQGEQGIQGEKDPAGDASAFGFPDELIGVWRNTEEYTYHGLTHSAREITFSRTSNGEDIKFDYWEKGDPNKKSDLQFRLINKVDDTYNFIHITYFHIIGYTLSVSGNQLTFSGDGYYNGTYTKEPN